MSTLHLLQFSETDKQEVLKHYGRTPENIQRDIDKIKEWLEKQPHLPETPDDKFIGNFLILNKFRIEQTKERLDMYYSIRSLVPEFYNKDPNGPEIQKLMDVVYVMPLPKLTEDLCRIVVAAKIKDADPDNFDVNAYAAHSYNLIEMRIREDCNLGVIFIYDLANLKPGHIAKMTPTVLKKIAFIMDKVIANRMRAIHLLNAPSFIDSFMFIIKGLLKPKITNRIFVHKNMDTFYKIIPKDLMPKDYGGDEKSLEELNNEWKQVFRENDALFKLLRSLKVDEALRPDKLNSDLLGIQGNFRKLDLD